MGVNCNITKQVIRTLNQLNWGLASFTTDNTPILESYIEKLKCSTLNYIPCTINDCINITTTYMFKISYWGWKDSNTVLTKEDIEASINYSPFAPGANIVADFRANGLPKYLWIAIAYSEPVATSWYGSANNSGSIGTDQDFFKAPVNVGTDFKFYVTNYPSQQQDTTIELRH